MSTGKGGAAAEPAVPVLCSKWMPRKQTTCGRRAGHRGDCRLAEALADHRQRKTARRRGIRGSADPAVRTRWARAHKLKRYGLTQAGFDRLLETQDHACAMCRKPFEDGKQIFIDHDHTCCPEEKRSCGACRRGLLCLRCNTALGYAGRYAELARKYLDSQQSGGPTSVVAYLTPVSGKVSGVRAISSVWDERFVDTEEVTGSSPVSPTR
jgi:hypothetical protein